MILTVDGAEIFATTGGKAFNPELPLVIFLHGAGSIIRCGRSSAGGFPTMITAYLHLTCRDMESPRVC
jgi:hypothetical protein